MLLSAGTRSAVASETRRAVVSNSVTTVAKGFNDHGNDREHVRHECSGFFR